MQAPRAAALALCAAAVLRVARGSEDAAASAASLRGGSQDVQSLNSKANESLVLLGAAEGADQGTVMRSLPAWCVYVPREYQRMSCRGGAVGCTCTGKCGSIPQSEWPWALECCGCPNNNESKAVPPQARMLGSDVPAWCGFVPEDFKDPMCRTRTSSCSCKDWCKVTPKVSQTWNPECCGCEEESEGNATANATVDKTVPLWCSYVPKALHSDACQANGPNKCSCKDFCRGTAPASQPWNPLCCRCDTADWAAATPAPSPKPRDTQNATLPAWCRWVPAAVQDVACKGTAAGCACKPWCRFTPEVSMPWNSECCSCANATWKQTAGAPPPRGDGEEGKPTWCSYIPEATQDAVCSGTECTCASWCGGVPPTWRNWSSPCCGCTTGTTTPPGSTEGPSSTVAPPPRSTTLSNGARTPALVVCQVIIGLASLAALLGQW